MAMTAIEEIAKKQLKTLLAKQGYKAYAKLLDMFDVNLTEDPGVVAYMEPNKARIVINRNLRIDQVSVIVRHEILHEFLEHHLRLLKHLAQQANLDYDKLTDMDIKELEQKLYSNQIFNIAADYEISNRGYTAADKQIVKNLILNGRVVGGLVTEEQHPDWVDLSVEEMYDRLNQQLTDEEKNIANNSQQGGSPSGSDSNQQSSSQTSNSQQSGSQSGDTGSNAADNQQGSSSQSGNQSKRGKRNPQIGDKGSPDIQAKEEAERIKEAAKAAENAAKEMQKGESDEAQDNADDLKDAAKKAKDLVKDLKDVEADIEADKELQKRVADIKKAFADAATQAELISEVDANIKQEKIDAETKAMLDYINDDVRKFKNSLGSFIKKATAEQKDRTWRRPSRRSTGDPGELLMKGRSWVKNKHIPVINVYFDQSASWSDDDIQVGIKALGVLNNFRDKGEIKLNVYFFAEDVHENARDARAENGTNLRAVFDHIKKTEPDNVVIMSDRDGDYAHLDDLTVPGAVWLLFKNDRSDNVIEHIHGKTQTQVYDIK